MRKLFVDALCREIELRGDYLNGEVVDTIYFGGGTPSLLLIPEMSDVMFALKYKFNISSNAEITLEANPDDINRAYLSEILRLGFNRLSMGVQSFDDSELKFLSRRHSAAKAIEAVDTARKEGFGNISIDLMYGLPGQTLSTWKRTLNTAIGLNIEHISSYHLIYEPGTKMERMLRQGAVQALNEDISVRMFSMLIDKLKQAGFIHYEISNFGREGYFSRHNSSYWLGIPYLGLGPAAHSYNTQERTRNVASMRLYVDGMKASSPYCDSEALDKRMQYNELVLTGMRTMWGVNLPGLEEQFGARYAQYFRKNIRKYIDSNHVQQHDGTYKLARNGIFISDAIMSDLMMTQ
jgi:oxygen-independent coproporphyrinogen-3 oxidase